MENGGFPGFPLLKPFFSKKGDIFDENNGGNWGRGKRV